MMPSGLKISSSQRHVLQLIMDKRIKILPWETQTFPNQSVSDGCTGNQTAAVVGRYITTDESLNRHMGL